MATIIVCLVIVGNSKAKYTDLISEIDTAWMSAISENQPEYLTKIDERSSYTIKKIEKDDKEYTISVEVDAPDLGGQLSKLDFEDLPQTKDIEELNAFLCTQIDCSSNIKTDTEIYATELDGVYKITFSDEFVDAMSGNIYSYSNNVLIDMLQSYEGGGLE